MRTSWIAAAVLLLLAGGVLWAVTRGEAGRGGSGDPRATGRSNPGGGQGRSPGVTWSWSVVVDSGAGHVGPWRMNRSDWRYVDDPTVALDAGGGAAVAWVDQARKDVFFRAYGPEGEPEREEPVNVSRSPDVFSWLPRLVALPGDGSRVYVLWQEIVFSGGTHGGEAFFARSTDGGRTFSEPLNLSRTEAGAGKGRLTPRRWHNGSLDLAVGPDGDLYAVWTVYEGGLWIARSDDGGGSFSAPLRVTDGEDGEPARAPSLAVSPDGTVHLAWAVGGDPAADLRYAVSTDDGRGFSKPRSLFRGPGHADAPKLAADGEGTLHLAWTESPGDRSGGHRIRYARSPAGAGGFGPSRGIVEPGDQRVAAVRFPSLDLDGDGDPHLVWELYPRAGRRSRGLGVTASTDGGDSFLAPAVVPGTLDPRFSVNGSLQGLLMRKLAVNGAGEIAVVNSGFEPGEASRIRLVRGEPIGRR